MLKSYIQISVILYSWFFYHENASLHISVLCNWLYQEHLFPSLKMELPFGWWISHCHNRANLTSRWNIGRNMIALCEFISRKTKCYLRASVAGTQKLQVFMVVSVQIMDIWAVTPCSFADGSQCFRGTYCLHLSSQRNFCLQGSRFLWNTGIHL